MRKFRVIPVLDILNSEVVHAIKGQRDKYKPIKSYLFETTNPINIAGIFKKKYNIGELYIADLDAILNKKPNLNILREISEIIHVIIDPGIQSEKDIELYMNLDITKLILGLETLEDLRLIKRSIQKFGDKRIIVSIDMFKEKVLTKVEELQNSSIPEVVQTIEEFGVKEIILLDLFKVGQKTGGIPPLYKKIRQIFTHEVLVGGGIRDFNNLLSYHKNGFSGVLIGTALYDGTIPMSKIREIMKN